MGSWDFSLSASKLGIFKDCKRCFWLQMTRKIERPRGIFPSLPGGMDRIIKSHFDQHRGDMPPKLRGQVPGVLWGSVEEINKLRNWQSGMKPIIKTPHGTVSLIGALDDLATDMGLFSPVDAKTKGSPVKEGDTEKYYGHQGDCYALMLRETGKPPSGKAYFFNVWPDMIYSNTTVGQSPGPIQLQFDQRTMVIDVDANRAVAMICQATELLRTADPIKGPEASKTCDYCKHHNALMVAGL